MENKMINIEMADMIGKTYFKIATWHNQDYDSDRQKQDALKHVCAEIINQVLEDAFLQLDGVNKTGVKEVPGGTPKKVINQTDSGTGKMVNFSEDAITRALMGNK